MIFLNLKKLVVRSWNVLNWNYSFSFFLNSTSLFICLEDGLLLGDPVFYALAGALLEGYAEGAVAAVTTAVGQLLGLDRLALGRLRAIGRKMRYEVYAKTGFSGDGRSLFLFLGTRPLRNWLHLVLSGWP